MLVFRDFYSRYHTNKTKLHTFSNRLWATAVFRNISFWEDCKYKIALNRIVKGKFVTSSVEFFEKHGLKSMFLPFVCLTVFEISTF